MAHKKRNLKGHVVFRLEWQSRHTFRRKTRIDIGSKIMALCLIMLSLKY